MFFLPMQSSNTCIIPQVLAIADITGDFANQVDPKNMITSSASHVASTTKSNHWITHLPANMVSAWAAIPSKSGSDTMGERKTAGHTELGAWILGETGASRR